MGTPLYVAMPSIASHDPDTRSKSNVGHEFLEIFICLWQIVIDTSGGFLCAAGGGGTVGSGDVVFLSSSNLVSTWCAAKKERRQLDQTGKAANLSCPFPVLQPEGQALN